MRIDVRTPAQPYARLLTKRLNEVKQKANSPNEDFSAHVREAERMGAAIGLDIKIEEGKGPVSKDAAIARLTQLQANAINSHATAVGDLCDIKA